MNRCTQLDEILHTHVPWQPVEPCWISRLYSKVFCAFMCAWFCGYPCAVLSLEQGLRICCIWWVVVTEQAVSEVIKHLGMSNMLHNKRWLWCSVCGCPCAVLSLEQGLSIVWCCRWWSGATEQAVSEVIKHLGMFNMLHNKRQLWCSVCGLLWRKASNCQQCYDGRCRFHDFTNAKYPRLDVQGVYNFWKSSWI